MGLRLSGAVLILLDKIVRRSGLWGYTTSGFSHRKKEGTVEEARNWKLKITLKTSPRRDIGVIDPSQALLVTWPRQSQAIGR